MDVVKLIELVKKKEELYDSSNQNYHDLNKRDSIWKDIALELGITVSECKNKWTSLRDTYRKFLIPTKDLNGRSTKLKKIWRYSKEMEFLKPFFISKKIYYFEPSDLSEYEKKNYKAIKTETRASPNGNKSPMAVLCEENHQQEQNVTSVICRYVADSQNMSPDPMTKFFECMLETVKNFSPELQIDVKTKIFRIVTDAEKINFNNTHYHYS